MYEVIGIDHNGRGIIKKDGKVIFVENALPNEKVDIEVIKDSKNYSIGKATKITNESPDRIKPICPYYSECGGCDLMHMSYDAELKYKQEKVKNILEKYASIKVEPVIIKCDNEYNYRNKIVLHKSNNKYGFYKKNSHNIIYINECKIAKKEINDVIRLAKDKDEVIFRSCSDGVISNIFQKSEGIIEIDGLRFNIDTDSFFQVNNYMCSKMLEIVKSFSKPKDVILDLYSGVSSLSIAASINAKMVYSIEINKNASKNAEKNVILNNRGNVKVINGDVKLIIKDLDQKFNKVIVDPPRSGLDRFTKSYLMDKEIESILYISCDSVTLARDLKELTQKYKVKNVTLLDMFPRTHHIESVVTLERD